MRIAVDAFGGDNAPLASIKGAELAYKEYGYEIVLVGKREEINKVAFENNIDLTNITIEEASDVIEIEDEPTKILKEKRQSSMAKTLELLADGKVDAAVSAGSTGALVVGGTFIVKRIKGIKRCALAAVMPSKKDYIMMLDVGANAEVKPEYLMQFGVMGKVYMENVMNVKSPKVALLNIGAEDCKGTETQIEAYKLLKDTNINFVGNIEGRDIMQGDVDVIVADGFSGNVALKTVEGVASTLFSMIKQVMTKNAVTTLAAAILKPSLKILKNKMDYSAVGGAPLLGTKKPVFKAHGSSNEIAFKNAIQKAALFAENKVIEKIEGSL